MFKIWNILDILIDMFLACFEITNQNIGFKIKISILKSIHLISKFYTSDLKLSTNNSNLKVIG